MENSSGLRVGFLFALFGAAASQYNEVREPNEEDLSSLEAHARTVDQSKKDLNRECSTDQTAMLKRLIAVTRAHAAQIDSMVDPLCKERASCHPPSNGFPKTTSALDRVDSFPWSCPPRNISMQVIFPGQNPENALQTAFTISDEQKHPSGVAFFPQFWAKVAPDDVCRAVDTTLHEGLHLLDYEHEVEVQTVNGVKIPVVDPQDWIYTYGLAGYHVCMDSLQRH